MEGKSRFTEGLSEMASGVFACAVFIGVFDYTPKEMIVSALAVQVTLFIYTLFKKDKGDE